MFFLINYLVVIFFAIVFLHIKIPRINIQGYKVNIETFTTGSRTEENPTYATTTPAAAMVAAPATIPVAKMMMMSAHVSVRALSLVDMMILEPEFPVVLTRNQKPLKGSY